MSEVKLLLGDCLELMKDIPDKSVNLICTDPPYNIGKAEWDKIPNYIDWCGEWLLECQRVLADNGSFYFFHNDMETIADLMIWIRENTEFVFKSMITWEKYQGNKQYYGRNVIMGVNNSGLRNYYPMSEYILFYTFQDETGLSMVFSDKDCFQPIKNYLDDELDKSEYSERTIKEVLCNDMNSHYFGFSKRDKSQFALPTKEQYAKLQTTGYFSREYEDLRREYEELRYTFNIIDKDRTRTWLMIPAPKNGHITPKPVEMIENIIRHSSNEGDLVLDLFMGSGTAGEACLKTNRRFIGIELDQEYFGIAEKRIHDAQQQMRLPI